MVSEQERFTHVMDLLELEVAGLEQHEDLSMVDKVSKLVMDISAKISSAEEQGGYELDYIVSFDHSLISLSALIASDTSICESALLSLLFILKVMPIHRSSTAHSRKKGISRERYLDYIKSTYSLHTQLSSWTRQSMHQSRGTSEEHMFQKADVPSM